MAESFSSMGVPVFLADIKGDLAGTCMPGENSEKIQERLEGPRNHFPEAAASYFLKVQNG